MFISGESSLLVHVQLAAHHSPQVISSRAPVQPVTSQPVLAHGFILRRCRALHFSLLNLRFLCRLLSFCVSALSSWCSIISKFGVPAYDSSFGPREHGLGHVSSQWCLLNSLSWVLPGSAPLGTKDHSGKKEQNKVNFLLGNGILSFLGRRPSKKFDL